MLLGFSYKSSQLGLVIDNVVGYELVLPNGTVVNVTSKDEDLWFGLRVSRKAPYKLVSLRICNAGRVQ
jgi:hypothetical protein